MTAFTVSGIAATVDDVTGEPYRDASGNEYLPMFRQPVFVYEATAEKMRTIYDRARSREVPFSLFTEELFATNNDIDNRAAIIDVAAPDLNIVGLALRADKKAIDKIFKGISLQG